MYREAPDQLSWLTTVIAGEPELTSEPALAPICPSEHCNPFPREWMNEWSRKLVIARAVGRVRIELKASLHRAAALARSSKPGNSPQGEWTRLPPADQAKLQDVLLAMDVFPRCVLALSVFERLSLDDTVVLLGADKRLIEATRAAALKELSANLAQEQLRPTLAGAQCALAAMRPTI
jgi:hypothetical protein